MSYNTRENTTGGFGATGGPAPSTDGPHKSDMLNKADPRVDSDRDYSRNMGMNPSGTADPTRQGTSQAAYRENMPTTTGTENASFGGFGGTTGRTTGTTGSSGLTGSSNVPEGTFGPHSSRVANAADPRVDSDLDRNTRTTGSSGLTGTTGRTTGTTGSSGLTGATGTTGRTTGTTGSSNIPEGTYGPHSSRTANAADPRIDSDLDSGRRNVGGTTTTGTHSSTTHTGTTASSGLTGSSASTGPAPNTAGPHKSDMLNKMDPRVDSNLDGSKTMGGDKTFSASGRTA